MFEFLKLSLVAAAFAYIGLALLALWMGPRMTFPAPTVNADPHPEAYRVPFSDQGAVAVRYLPNPDAGALLLYHHGNAEDLSNLEGLLQLFRHQGFAVLAYDYPGYGHSDGTPGERAIVQAAEAVLRHATDALGWPPEDVVSYGRSLGGGPCLALAARHRLRGAVLEATFTSTFRVMTRWRLLPWDVFNNISLIRRSQCPVLIIHGRRDKTVPFHHARRLFEAAPEGSTHLWIDDANHIDILEKAGDAYWTTLRAFAFRRAQPQSEPS